MDDQMRLPGHPEPLPAPAPAPPPKPPGARHWLFQPVKMRRVIRYLPQAGRIAWRAFMRFQDHNGPDRAAAVSYYTLLSLLPLLIFMISMGVAFMGSFEAAYEGTLRLMGGVALPLNSTEIGSVHDFVERATRFKILGLFLLAWTSRRAFAALFSALERVFDAPSRSFATHNLLALTMVLAAAAALLVTMVMTTVIATSEGLLQRFTGYESLEALTGIISSILTQMLPLAVTFLFFFLVYRLVPAKTVSTTHALIGAVLATALWEIAKRAFAYYLRNLARYAGVYGTLEGVVVLAIWVEISASIILYCGEVVALIITPERKQRRIPFSPPDPPPAAGGVAQ